ncbi:MAG: hypothetical protein WCP95_02730 [Actinomycetes bacterium]
MADAVKRPIGVTLVFIVILITGAFQLLAGFLRLFNRGDNATVGLWAALITIAIGVVYLLVAKGIANGSSFARFIVAALTVLMIAAAVWMLFAAPSLWVALIIQILLGLIVLLLLYSARASMFFKQS